jgi:peptidoglycan/LPS O-acetylase OafA/YrhL
MVVFCTYHSPWAEKILGNRLMDRLGKASYITYIVQAPLWHYFLACSNFLGHRPLSQSSATMTQFLLFGLLLVLASLVLDAFVDEPVRTWLRRSGNTRQGVTSRNGSDQVQAHSGEELKWRKI